MTHTTSGQRVTLLIIVLSALFGLSGLISLALLKIAMMSALPVRNFAEDISNINDLAVLKTICVPLAEEYSSRMNAFRATSKWGPLFLTISGILCFSIGVYLYHLLGRERLEQSHENAQEQNRRKSVIELAFSGELKLWKAFWFFYVPVPLICGLGITLLLGITKRIGDADSFGFDIFMFLPIILAAAFISVLSVAIITWRCAANTSYRFLFYVTRGLILLYVVTLLTKAALFIVY
jgi:hypothetical protein